MSRQYLTTDSKCRRDFVVYNRDVYNHITMTITMAIDMAIDMTVTLLINMPINILTNIAIGHTPHTATVIVKVHSQHMVPSNTFTYLHIPSHIPFHTIRLPINDHL